MTADEMAVDGYYVVAGIARHEYKQGWKFLTLWDAYGLSEATWEPMSAFIHVCRAPYPILRVPHPLKRGSDGIGATSRVFQTLQHQKTSLFAKK